MLLVGSVIAGVICMTKKRGGKTHIKVETRLGAKTTFPTSVIIPLFPFFLF